MEQFWLTRRRMLAYSAAFAAAGCTMPVDCSQTVGTMPLGSWTPGASLPFTVQEIYPCLHDERIHLAGGLIAPDGMVTGATDQHVSWAPGEAIWRSEPALWQPLHHPQLISYGGDLWAIGGFARNGDAGWIMQTECRRLIDGIWLTSTELPVANGESTSAVVGDTLHVCGGRRPSGASNAQWSDHIDTDSHWIKTDPEAPWQAAAPLPTARNSAAGGVIRGHLHVVGGRTVGGGNRASHEVYEVREDRWRSAAPLPQAQGGLAAASLGDRLYAFGGEYFGPDGGGVYPECWVYNPDSDSWDSLPDMPHPRHGLGAVAIDSHIYVIGGALKASGSETSNLVEVFTP